MGVRCNVRNIFRTHRILPVMGPHSNPMRRRRREVAIFGQDHCRARLATAVFPILSDVIQRGPPSTQGTKQFAQYRIRHQRTQISPMLGCNKHNYLTERVAADVLLPSRATCAMPERGPLSRQSRVNGSWAGKRRRYCWPVGDGNSSGSGDGGKAGAQLLRRRAGGHHFSLHGRPCGDNRREASSKSHRTRKTIWL